MQLLGRKYWKKKKTYLRKYGYFTDKSTKRNNWRICITTNRYITKMIYHFLLFKINKAFCTYSTFKKSYLYVSEFQRRAKGKALCISPPNIGLKLCSFFSQSMFRFWALLRISEEKNLAPSCAHAWCVCIGTLLEIGLLRVSGISTPLKDFFV